MKLTLNRRRTAVALIELIVVLIARTYDCWLLNAARTCTDEGHIHSNLFCLINLKEIGTG